MLTAFMGAFAALVIGLASFLPSCSSDDLPVRRYCTGLTLSSCFSSDGARCTASEVRVQKTSWGGVSQMTCTRWSLPSGAPYRQPRPLVEGPPILWEA